MNKIAIRYSNIAALALIVQGAMNIVFSMTMTSLSPERDGWLRFVLLAVFSIFLNVLPAAMMHYISGKPTDSEIQLTGLAEKPKRSDKVAVTAGSAALVFAIGLLYEKVFPAVASDIPVSIDTPVYMHILMIVALCVAPSVCEELLFRHVIASRLAVAGKTSAVISSAIMFGLAHFSAAMFPYAFFAGILFGWVFFRTGSVKYSIAAHFICNFTTYLFACAKQVMTGGAYSTLEIVTLAAFLAAALLLSFVDSRGASDAFKRSDEHAAAGSVLTPLLAVYAAGVTAIILLWGQNG